VQGKATKTYQLFPVILALGLATSLCGAMGHVASAQPQGPPTAEQCEQAKLKASVAEASVNAAERNARVAEEIAYQANREAKATDFRAVDAEAVAEAIQRRLEDTTEASRRGHSLGPDPSEARRDYVRKLTERDRAREVAEDARIRADDRRRDAQTERDYANQLRVAAQKLRNAAEDLCARQQAAERE
jgi:hypothetical protein